MADPVTSTLGSPAENSTIKQMREQIDALNSSLTIEQQARATAETKTTELEREKLSEKERLELQLKDLQTFKKDNEPIAAQLQAATQELESQYNALIASAPVDKQEVLKQISATGDWPTRLRTLRAGLSLATGAAAVAPQVTVVGTINAPPTPDPARPAGSAPNEPQQPNWKASWGDVLSKPTPGVVKP